MDFADVAPDGVFTTCVKYGSDRNEHYRQL